MNVDIVYDKQTGRVMVFKCGDNWVIPATMDLASFRNGAEPSLIDINGDIYLKPNALIIKPEYFE